MSHRHVAAHTSRAGHTLYETCDCGAVRITRDGKHAEPWHACKLCVSGFGGPDPIAAVARELEAAEGAAPPLAEAPFALSAPVSDRRAVDGRLF